MSRSYLVSQSSLLRVRPLVVGSVFGERALSSQIKNASSNQVDVVELRLDSFSPVVRPLSEAIPFSAQLIRRIRRTTNKPLILTLRSSSERGDSSSRARPLSDQRRAVLLRALLPLCQLVDIEIRRSSFVTKMTRWAHLKGIDVIHSLHDFKRSNNFSLYSKFSLRSSRLRGDIFKIAVAPRSNDELEKFFEWGGRLKNSRRVLIGMGSVGFISRCIGFTFGSILTYGHLGASAAPGQISASELGTLIRRIYPR